MPNATGSVLVALREVGGPSDQHTWWQRGVGYLLRTQKPTGRGRSKPEPSLFRSISRAAFRTERISSFQPLPPAGPPRRYCYLSSCSTGKRRHQGSQRDEVGERIQLDRMVVTPPAPRAAPASPIFHLTAFRERRDELGLDVLAEAMTHAAKRLAEGTWIFGEVLGEGRQIAVPQFAANKWLQGRKEFRFSGGLPLIG